MIMPLETESKPFLSMAEKYDQARTPYFDALKNYIDSGVTTFHVPGHHQGNGADPHFRDFVKKYGLAADVSQVMGLDDVHQPSSVIEDAQDLAARAYGADYTYFLINGSSSGNLAMIMSAVNPGEKLILPRNVHRSATGALILSGALPVYLEPEYDPDMQVDHTVTPETLERALEENPDAKAVFILSPTYYGAACDIKRMVDIVHSHGKPALVDEAWGPHFNFHPDLPQPAVSAGADLVVNSTHKLMGSMAQASMLHLKGDRIDRGRLQSSIRQFLSTSPSCLLLASLDAARRNMAVHGRHLLDKALELAEYVRKGLREIDGVRAFGYEIVGKPGVHALDGTRLTVTAKELDLTGYDIELILRTRYNLQFEMSELFNCVALITVGNTMEEMDKIVAAFREVKTWSREHRSLSKIRLFYKRKNLPMQLPDWPRQVMTPREAFVAPFETVPIRESRGRICAEMLTPYPPGIPILRHGEEITEEIIDHLLLEMEAGVHIQGPMDPELNTIRVVK